MTILMLEEGSWVSLRLLWMGLKLGLQSGVKASLTQLDNEHETNSFPPAHQRKSDLHKGW